MGGLKLLRTLEIDWTKQDRQNLNRLEKRKVQTVNDLVENLPALPSKLKYFGLRMVSLLDIREAEDVLLEMISEPEHRLAVAHALSCLTGTKRSRKKVKRFFLNIVERELSQDTPEQDWLLAAIIGLGNGFGEDVVAVDSLVTIYERNELPGWLRGEAADQLGTCAFISDRRTRLFKRCCETAIKGIQNGSIEMQFWSMYLICSMAANREKPVLLKNDPFYPALRKLRQIAKQDHRLAPGLWWPLSAEAEDAIGCIQTGQWPQPQAAERWIENAKKNIRGTS